MSTLDRLKGTEISTKTAVSISILAVVLTIACLMVFAAKKPEESTSIPSPRIVKAHNPHPIKADIKENSPAGKDKKCDEKAGPEKPKEAWEVIANRNIFKPIGATAPSPPTNSHPVSKPSPPPSRPIPPMPLAVLPTFPGAGGGSAKGLAYTGIVRSPDGVFALIENTTTGETKYAREGDNVFGMQVTRVDPRSVSLSSFGQSAQLSIGENKPAAAATPAPAGPTPPPGGQPTPPQPNAGPKSSLNIDRSALREARRVARRSGNETRRPGQNRPVL